MADQARQHGSVCACCVHNECECQGQDIVPAGSLFSRTRVADGVRTVVIAVEVPGTTDTDEAVAVARRVLDTQDMPVAVIEPNGRTRTVVTMRRVQP